MLSAAGRTGAAVADALPIVGPFARAARQIAARAHRLVERVRDGRDIEDDPMRPRPTRWLGGVGIFQDEREALRLGRRFAPLERRRRVSPVTRVDCRYFGLVLELRRGE